MALKPQVLAEGFLFPEGPRWHEGKLWFSDIHAHQVRTLSLSGKSEVVAEMEDRPSGIGFLPDGTPIVTLMRKCRVLKLGAKGATVFSDLKPLGLRGINDMVVDRHGRAYVDAYGQPDATGSPMDGIAMVTPDGAHRRVAEGMRGTNGLMITPDGKTLLAGETAGQRITAFDIAADGSLSNMRLWADVAPHHPDGSCLDAEGAVWTASPYTSAFIRVREGGRVVDRVPLKDKIAIACMLGGEGRRTLFLLTNGMRHEDISPVFSGQVEASKVCRGIIETVRVDVPGAGWP